MPSRRTSTRYDVVVLGAGAGGMMAAIEAGKRGRSVLVVDHAQSPGEKIRISGGGRCNFTNTNATTRLGRERFLSQNPRFALSALSRYTPADIIALVKRFGIAFHEKTLGQLFCDGSSLQVINLLTSELRTAGAELRLSTAVDSVAKTDDGFIIALAEGPVSATSLIVATGGKSIPKMGATNFGYRIAEQFGLRVTETRPGLVPLTFEPGLLSRTALLSGIGVHVRVSAGKHRFEEALLFTHRGLSGPAILQISSYWREGDAIAVDFLPQADALELLQRARKDSPRLHFQTVLAQHLPQRLAQLLAEDIALPGQVGDLSDSKLKAAAAMVHGWTVKPTGSEGYRTAEVTLGGVDTRDLDAATLAARAVPGLHIVGEVVDVTGWLGGYNFQWAWASGAAAGRAA